MFKNYMQEVWAISAVLSTLGISHEISVRDTQKNFAKNIICKMEIDGTKVRRTSCVGYYYGEYWTSRDITFFKVMRELKRRGKIQGWEEKEKGVLEVVTASGDRLEIVFGKNGTALN